LVQHFSLPELPNLTQGQIEAIRGFGTITSRSIVQGLQRLSPTLKFLLDLGFSIIATAQELPQEASSPLVGKHVVFTGKMHKSREEMEEQARTLGALVQSAVNAKTDYLVCGEKVGASKTNKAQQMGTTILTEQAYLRLIGAEEWEEQA
jgi:DNA ligase (NAD+)